MRSASTDSKTPYNYAHTSTPKAAWSHRYNAAKKRQTDRSRNRRTDEVPFIAGCSHFTRKNTRFRAPASSPKHSPCNIHAAITMRSATTLHQGQVSIAHHPSRSSLNRAAPFKVKSQSDLQPPFIKVMWSLTPPFKVKSQSRTTLQGQVSIAHHPSRSSLNRTPPFKVKSQSRTTLQGQVSIAHHPSRSSVNRAPPFLNRAPPFKVKSQSHTTLQGQVSIAHHPSRSSVNRAPPFLNRAPPFKVKSQSHTTLQGQVSIAHHPSSFQDSEFYLSVPRKYCFPTSFDHCESYPIIFNHIQMALVPFKAAAYHQWPSLF